MTSILTILALLLVLQAFGKLQGTGTKLEMKIEERGTLANEGLVVAAVAVDRRPDPGSQNAAPSESDSAFQFTRLQGSVKLSSRALWLGNGRLIPQLHTVSFLPRI